VTDGVLQRLGRGEGDLALGRNHQRFTCLGVAAGALGGALDLELAGDGQRNFAAALQLLTDGLLQGVDKAQGVGLGGIGLGCEVVISSALFMLYSLV
jgi:hypothetical protein